MAMSRRFSLTRNEQCSVRHTRLQGNSNWRRAKRGRRKFSYGSLQQRTRLCALPTLSNNAGPFPDQLLPTGLPVRPLVKIYTLAEGIALI